MNFRKLPSGLSFWHPAVLISTFGGTGLLPIAPGTWGSLFSLPLAWFIASEFGSLSLLIASAIALLAGLWSSTCYLKSTCIKDPGTIVIDETAGQLLVLAFVPLDIRWYLAGFILFRTADILKPWPASWADRYLPGALGVMTDDIFAALYPIGMLYIANKYIIG